MSDSGPTILIADDHPRMRRLICSILGNSGYEIIEVSNRLEAVAAFHEFHPAWVIMDVDMPQMDGLAATRSIQESQSETRIIIVTQHDSDAIHQQALDCGACEFLPKPHLTRLPELVTSAT